MSKYEHCCECNERTGRAGASDDSLYLGSVGPFCEDCVDTWPDKMDEAYGRLMAMNAELTEEIGHLEDSLIKQGQMLREIVNITKGVPLGKMHSTHDAVDSVDRLRARVAELEGHMHKRCSCPGYEYATTDGPRKAFLSQRGDV